MQPPNHDQTPLPVPLYRDKVPGELLPISDQTDGAPFRRGRLLRELVRINRAIARTRRRIAQIESRLAEIRRGRQRAA